MKRFFAWTLILLLMFCGALIAQPRTSRTGIDIVKNFEGIRTSAYRCPANVLTIGYGHTGKDVFAGMIITNAQAEQLLIKDLVRFEKYVNSKTKRLLLFNEFDALVSFTFNVGSMSANLQQFVNRGDAKTAIYILQQYCKARVNGVLIVLPGLVKRRAAESYWYSTGNEKILRQTYLTNLKN